jgi:hypothetical protein
MRLIKPLRLSIVQRMLTVRRDSRLCVGLLVYFPFEAPDHALPEIAMWQRVVKEVGKDAALDEGLAKPRGEILVHGKAFAPGGQPKPVVQARLEAGRSINRSTWSGGGGGRSAAPRSPSRSPRCPSRTRRRSAGRATR